VRYLPAMDKTNKTRLVYLSSRDAKLQELIADMDVSVAGRIAEEVVYGKDSATTGATSDFRNLVKLARNFVMRYGFSEKVSVFEFLN
jgi:ATP-dependent Zn protease